MLTKQKLEELVLERLKNMVSLPEEVLFFHRQNYWIGDEEIADGRILVLVGPSPGMRWTKEDNNTKRRSLFVSVRVVAQCDQTDAGRIAAMMALSDGLLGEAACMTVKGEENGVKYAAYSETTEYDPIADPLVYDRLANNVFYTSFTIEFRDRQLFRYI